MVALTLVAGSVAVAGRVLSPAIVLDLVALWPIAAIAVLAGVVAFFVRKTRPRLLALSPLVLLTWLLLGSGLHLAGWEALPSSSAEARGPDAAGVGIGVLSIELSQGSLNVTDASVPDLYRLTFERAGGSAGAPLAGLAVGEGRARVVITERQDSFWFRFAGWNLELSPGPRWILELAAQDLRADLSGLSVSQLSVSGAGEVVLGEPVGEGNVQVTGSYRISVPSTIPVEVIGEARVPSNWVATAEGAASPAEGQGWLITVAEGASLQIESA